jgi:anti-anti-sigma regulatory factor
VTCHYPVIIVPPECFDEQAARDVRDLTAALVDRGSRKLIFDLTRVTRIDVCGQGVLIGAKWRLDGYGERPAVVAEPGQDHVLGPMARSGLLPHLDIYESVDDAIAGLTGTAEGTDRAA